MRCRVVNPNPRGEPPFLDQRNVQRCADLGRDEGLPLRRPKPIVVQRVGLDMRTAGLQLSQYVSAILGASEPAGDFPSTVDIVAADIAEDAVDIFHIGDHSETVQSVDDDRVPAFL